MRDASGVAVRASAAEPERFPNKTMLPVRGVV
jgi:hypothetical protein